MPFLFENLFVYQKSLEFCKTVSKLTDSFPKGNYYLTDQLNRAALSISLNIAEGNGRWYANDRKQFFVIARGSVHECIPILEVCASKPLLTKEIHESLLSDLEEISKMIAGLIRGSEEERSA
jgi:four helix bundle protein